MNELTRTHCVLTLPGWQGSGPEHWQTRWEQCHGYQRVQQHNWMQPLRGDWMMQLEQAVLAARQPVLLVAHSLGCVLVAAWAAHSQHTGSVRAALLVAPGDVERDALRDTPLRSWRPIVRQRLPFASTLVASHSDPYCSFDRAAALAHDWGSALVDAGNAGHINAESQLGDWNAGHLLLENLIWSHDA